MNPEPQSNIARFPPNDETTASVVDTSAKRLLRPARDLACLVVIAGVAIGEKFPLGEERLVIGRQSDAGVPIEDPLISRHHVEVLVHEGSVVIRDLGSRNGTYCNEHKITEETLKDGDMIRIGGSVLKYVGPDSVDNLFVSLMADRARLDSLTGLFNKHAFHTYFDRSFARCRNLNEPLSVVLMDLDFFKQINDRWGHPAGDFVLKEIGALLKDGFRPADFFARYGGEELGLILPHTLLREAESVAERMRIRVAGHVFRFDGHTIAVTMSVGVAELTEGVEDAATLLARADKALYNAKREGRNRTCCFLAPK